MFDVNESGVFQVRTEHRALPRNMFAQLGWFSISLIIYILLNGGGSKHPQPNHHIIRNWLQRFGEKSSYHILQSRWKRASLWYCWEEGRSEKRCSTNNKIGVAILDLKRMYAVIKKRYRRNIETCWAYLYYNLLIDCQPTLSYRRKSF